MTSVELAQNIIETLKDADDKTRITALEIAAIVLFEQHAKLVLEPLSPI